MFLINEGNIINKNARVYSILKIISQYLCEIIDSLFKYFSRIFQELKF